MMMMPGVVAGPDEDGDEWNDMVDNCPSIANPEQRDRDRDGIGNDCDTCPSTPNNDPNGLTQSDCTLVGETEPNNNSEQAQAIVVPQMGEAIAIAGTIEAPANDTQSADRFMIMVASQSLVSIRCARASPQSLLEPQIEVEGGSYTVSRRSHGQHTAERQFYFTEAGTYEVTVSDRRMRFENVPKGSPDYAYELSIQALDVEAEKITPPFIDRPLRLEPEGSIGIFSTELMVTEQIRIEVQTTLASGEDGADPILLVERADGTLWEENHKYTPGIFDARLLLKVDEAEEVRIVIDHRELIGESEGEMSFTLDYPDLQAELEPNHTRELASKLNFCQGCETRGTIQTNSPSIADIDWYTFEGQAGQIVSFRGLIPANSQVDPYMELGRFESSLFVPIYDNGTSSGVSARFDAILPEDGTYYLRFQDELNKDKESEPYRGGGLYTYTIFTEFLVIPPAPELSGGMLQSGVINPGGILNRYLLTLTESAEVSLSVNSPVQESVFEPQIRLYNPGAQGLIAEGTGRLDTVLQSAGSYIVTVNNKNAGLGGPGFTYELSAAVAP